MKIKIVKIRDVKIIVRIIESIFVSLALLAMQAVAHADNLSFNCVTNYDQAEVEKKISNLLSSLQGEIQADLATFKGSSNGASYSVTPKTVVVTGAMTVHAPVVDSIPAVPCGDAIDLSLTIPNVVIKGTWSVSYLGFGHNGTFTDTITDLTVKALAQLATLDASTAKPGYDYSRNVTKVVTNGYNVGSNHFVVDGGNGVIGNILTSLSNLMKSTIMDQVYKSASGTVIADPNLASLPAPVTVKVVSKP